MAAPFPNLYTLRKVSDAAAKSCDVCYKLTTSVLITPDNKDFFYICPIHLKDTYFCSPKVDEEAVKARREKELAEETEKLKKEYEERQRRKKEKEAKDKQAQSKDEDKGRQDDAEKKQDQEKTKDKPKEEAVATPPAVDEPRVFELKSAFYKQRIQRKRQSEAAKRDRERASQPNYFPSVPTDHPRK